MSDNFRRDVNRRFGPVSGYTLDHELAPIRQDVERLSAVVLALMQRIAILEIRASGDTEPPKPRYEVIADEVSLIFDFDENRHRKNVRAKAGEIVYLFKGETYGLISPYGVACSREGETVHPFFEVQLSNLRAASSPEGTQP